jgi:hypothetical protein
MLKALSYLVASWRHVTLTLVCNPLSNLPPSFNRKQRWFGDREIGVIWPAVVRQAGGDGSVIAIGQANDEIRIWSASYTDEPNALAIQRMMRMSHRHPFHRRFGKGGSLL